MKRTNKFYRENEKKIMKRLGLIPTIASGAGIQKEDGENDYLIAQLKTTEKNQITIKKQDVKDLVYHASLSHKIPIFVVQFLDTYGDTEYILLGIHPNEIKKASKYLRGE